ncbi:4-hydroxy-tetrahydrodipicolinate synthase [Cupriavidus sp.]|uniref:4-hydroxy-tetrahydrodipicolinate synthase n=1 Tax=Cupriavidus sp. TaxID=1873897 RepID=UPI0025C64623|nr:4-hydroxy-tetrahydrodipicolinate synthase [Cupriavidus sp.]MCA3184090.1 4-hydroxy-tetrahydrodipicolinate synthase [Cupriavidus sp.]MCA3192966.1 4-hydroxy-tetrahydrodipicolinate synthase [Cupriavidus sp.]MCA3195818.1 4-hydroxy-tetrahydrodipicolinate synthase [Cupriavidus sp.]MCA3204719.1 4-hydroxy-tetrahydrodipicolinate synthase [Cupriavidus sp.]MCA3206851.1 4-hydroxy-tetrahydrodipicolinate synthase [Cupriavidus sp.]
MHATQTSFQGIWLPLVTPFIDNPADPAVDHAALRRLVTHYRATGLAGFVVCGSTGEAAALDEAEQLAVLDTVLEAAAGLPVAMGLAGNHLGHAMARLERLNSRPLAGVLAPAPYYIRPSQAGLHDWFTRLADAARAPLVLYDIPYRTGAALTLDTLLSLADHDNIVAIKDCGGNAQATQALIADGRLSVLAGEDHQLLGTLALGGRGAIIASAHFRPELFVEIWRAVAEGRLDDARRLFHALMPLVQALFAEPNPGPAKALLARHGWLADTLRPPMTSASPQLADQLAALHDGLDGLERLVSRP